MSSRAPSPSPHTGAQESVRSRGSPAGLEYTPRAPTDTLLYSVLHQQLEPFLQRANERGQPAPRFIEQTLRAYLRCGVLAHGFLRLHCEACKLDRLVPFSCKRRGICPSCQGRTMADTAAHLVDRVLPLVPIRQWVLTLPYPLRYRCAYDAQLTSDVLRAFVRALFAGIRRRARRDLPPQASQPNPCGSVSFLQRFGSALNLNLHFHTLALDGAYLYQPSPRATPTFVTAPPPTADDVARVLAGTAGRLKRLLIARAENSESAQDALERDEPLLALLTQASLQSRIATGPEAGHPWKRLGDRVEPEAQVPGSQTRNAEAHKAIARHGEMSLHADVAVPANDRKRLERLCRYAARPPLAHDRLAAHPDGSLTLRLKTRWRDGTTQIVMQPRDLIDRIVPLIPPPRAHQVRYHGILAPAASLRDSVVPASVQSESQGTTTQQLGGTESAEPAPNATHDAMKPRRTRWAALLRRVFAVDALACPRCGATLRLLAAIEDPAVARAILLCLGLPARAPPPRAADSEPATDEDAPFDFDQRTPYDDR